jgi:hypothetical protein
MNSMGVAGEFLIVAIEVSQSGAAARTSVNYSGPTSAVLQKGWDVSEALLVE